MYINALGMRGIYSQESQSAAGRTGGVNQYDYHTVMQKALEKRNAAIGATSVLDGDMIITRPSYAQNTASRKKVTDQAKSEMSMEEYRQWFRNEVFAIQSETSAVSPYISDTLVIKEEAFEKMKSDPEWEKEVLGKIKAHCDGKEMTGTKAIGYQIIGGSAENCREEGIPVNTTSAYSAFNGISPYAALSYGYPYMSSLYGNYLTQGLLGGQSSLGGMASGAYRNVMNGGWGSSLLGNFLI